MTIESALRYQEGWEITPKIFIENLEWTENWTVSEKTERAITTGGTALFNSLRNSDNPYPLASSTSPSIRIGSLLKSNPAGQSPTDLQATRDMELMAASCSNSLLRLVASSILFMDERLVAFAALERPDSALFSDTSHPRLSQSSAIKQQSITVPHDNITSHALQKDLLRQNDLAAELGSCVKAARYERFEDGMSSTYANCVHESFQKHGSFAVTAWERVLHRYGNLYETGEELLRQFGLLQHGPSHKVRMHVLMENLNSSDPRIRDAAGLGLSFLDDPMALTSLREAYQAESEPWLRESLKLVIDQLETLA